MKKLQWSLRGMMYLFSLISYITLAMWVVQDGFGDMDTRVTVAWCGIVWVGLAALIIDGMELPKELAKALTEDFGD